MMKFKTFKWSYFFVDKQVDKIYNKGTIKNGGVDNDN